MDRVVKGHPYAKAAVDVACHDLAGKALGVPVWKLLGGRQRDGIEVTHSLGIMEVDRCLAEDRQHLARGPQESLARLAARVRGRRPAESGAGHHPPIGFLLHVRDRRQHDALERGRHRLRVNEHAGRFLQRHANAGHRDPGPDRPDAGPLRRAAGPDQDRRVHVYAKESRRQAVYVIRDEGPGFDPSALPDPTDPSNLEKASGRGLLLIRTFMDEVHHNEDGNQITMVKHGDR